MPRFDGTGPRGEGAMTGRGMGFCAVPLGIAAGALSLFGFWRRFRGGGGGRGFGWGGGRGARGGRGVGGGRAVPAGRQDFGRGGGRGWGFGRWFGR